MSSGVLIQANTANFIPGAVARQREMAIRDMYNYLPVGTYLAAAFGTDAQYANSIIASRYELAHAVVLPSIVILGTRVYMETEFGLQFVFNCIYSVPADAVWSSVFIEGDYFLCLGNVAVWQIDRNILRVTEVTDTLPYVPAYISSFGLRMVIGTNDTVSWSSPNDRLDFNVGATGAGSQAINVLGAYGKLLAIGSAPNGFVVYTTRGILVAATTDTPDIPFSFQTSILSGFVLDNSYAQTSNTGHTPMAIFKGRGLCAIVIANEETKTATVNVINPFIGQSETARENIKLFSFFGGYTCIDVDQFWYFMEGSEGAFGELPKRHWAVLVPNTSLALDFDGNLFRLSTEQNVITYNDTDKTVYPENIVHCDIANKMDCVQVVVSDTGAVDTLAGAVEQYTMDLDFTVIAPYLPDGFDCMMQPTVPVLGEDYQDMWERIGNILPVKIDTHEEVVSQGGIDLQPPADYAHNGCWDFGEFIRPIDSFNIVYGAMPVITSKTLLPEATFTGIRANEENANLHTKLNSLLVYEYAGSNDKVINCNLEDGEINCNIMPDATWVQSAEYTVEVSANGSQFHYQKDNLFTGLTRATNHEVTVRGAQQLSELRATLIKGGYR